MSTTLSPTKYEFNFHGFNLASGLSISKVAYNGQTITLAAAVSVSSVNDIIEFLTRMALVESVVESKQNILTAHSRLDFDGEYFDNSGLSVANAIYFTYNSVDYVVKSDGKPARTEASFDSDAFPLYTIPVTISRGSMQSLNIRLIIQNNVIFVGSLTDFLNKYNVNYVVDEESGQVTVTLSDDTTTVVDPFETLDKFATLLADIPELCSFGNDEASSWSYGSGVLSITSAAEKDLTASIQCYSTDLV